MITVQKINFIEYAANVLVLWKRVHLFICLPRLGETHCWSNAARRMLSASLGITHLDLLMMSDIDLTENFTESLVVTTVLFTAMAPFLNDSLVIVTVLSTTLAPFCFTQSPIVSHAFLTFSNVAVVVSLKFVDIFLTIPTILPTGPFPDCP